MLLLWEWNPGGYCLGLTTTGGGWGAGLASQSSWRFRPPCTKNRWKTRTKNLASALLGTRDSVRLGQLCSVKPPLDIFHVRVRQRRVWGQQGTHSSEDFIYSYRKWGSNELMAMSLNQHSFLKALSVAWSEINARLSENQNSHFWSRLILWES